MVAELKGILYYLAVNTRHSLIVFWSILLSILVVTLLLTSLFTTTVFINVSSPIYVYSAIMGFITVKLSIPYLVKVGAVRKTLFIGIGIYFTCLALFNVLIVNTLMYLFSLFNNEKLNSIFTFHYVSTDNEAIPFNHLVDLIGITNTWGTRIIIDVAIVLLLISLLYIQGLIHYRYGIVGSVGTMGVMVIFLIIGFSKGWLWEWILLVFSNIELNSFYQMAGIGVVLYLLSYLLLRKITIKA